MRILLVPAAWLLLAAAPSGSPVPLQARPGTEWDRAARTLVAEDLADATANADRPLVLTGTATLGGAADRPALFVQLQSARECGSAGCTTAVYWWNHGAWKRVLDGTSGPLSVAPQRTRGMADLVSGAERYTWTGSEYRNTRPAPNVDLRPRQARH